MFRIRKTKKKWDHSLLSIFQRGFFFQRSGSVSKWIPGRQIIWHIWTIYHGVMDQWKFIWFGISRVNLGLGSSSIPPPSDLPFKCSCGLVLVFLCRSSHQRGFINGANFLKIHRNTPVSDSFVIKLQAFRRIEHIFKNICVRLLLTMVSNICQISVVFAKYFPSFDLIFPP